MKKHRSFKPEQKARAVLQVLTGQKSAAQIKRSRTHPLPFESDPYHAVLSVNAPSRPTAPRSATADVAKSAEAVVFCPLEIFAFLFFGLWKSSHFSGLCAIHLVKSSIRRYFPLRQSLTTYSGFQLSRWRIGDFAQCLQACQRSTCSYSAENRCKQTVFTKQASTILRES